MIKLNSRGSVLVHVLVTGVIVAFIAAGLLRMVLMDYIVVDRAAKGAQNRKEAEALLNRAVTSWNQANQVCSTIGPPGPYRINCTGVPGTCNCSCPSAAAVPRIDARIVGGQCVIDLISSDPP